MQSSRLYIRWVSLMPDTHMGKGMPIGGVIATKGVIIPNAVGSDIGCGMIFVPMNVKLAQIQGIMTGNGSLIQLLVGDILRNIPVGVNRYKTPQESAVLDRAKEQMELYEQNPEEIWEAVKGTAPGSCPGVIRRRLRS